MDTKNYSLEKHLEAICNNDSDYNILLATWRLNKENLTLALSSIALQFPHYSMHDATHSIKILENIQRLLGCERIERLGATDTFLLLMTALTHDLGMYLTYKMLEEKWDLDEMQSLLEQYAESDDKQISQAARLIINHGHNLQKTKDNYRWALEIRNAVTLVVAYQMRRGHGDRGADYIEKDSLINKLTHGFHFDLLPNRFLSLMAKVAYLHGTDFDKLLTTLPHKANGFKGDFIHPRFVASMIRMGDLLDVDNNRFNLFTIATVKELPESSLAHYDKHQAVKHLLISPEGIEADLDCPTEESYRVAREMFDWLESEVSNLSREWSVIAPSDLGGLPPVLHKEKINIYYQSKRTRPELRNLRFDISSQRTFEMLKGGAIYEKPGRVFLREIVQNSEDATRLQIWKDLDIHLPFSLKNPNRTINTREDIKFSDDIPTDVYNKYPISLKVDYDDKEQVVTILCEDWGTGISEESLIRMTSQVGVSRKGDKGYEEMVKSMPYFLKPSAAFGLGLQTIFYVTDEFSVDTQYPGEPRRHIVFRTSTNGSYCSSSDEDYPLIRDGKVVHHGTTVTIKIDREHLGKLFELDTDVTNEMLSKPEVIVYYIISKVDDYAKRAFNSLVDIPIKYQSPYTTLNSQKDEMEIKYLLEDACFRIYELGNKILIEEKKYGSRIQMFLFESDDFFCRLYYRGKPVDFLHLHWRCINALDLYSSEADKILNISRDGLLAQGYTWCREILNDLMPDIVRIMYNVLKDKIATCSDPTNQFLYQSALYKICLNNWILSSPLQLNYTLIGDIRQTSIFSSDGSQAFAKDIFQAESLVIILESHSEQYSFKPDEVITLFINEHTEMSKNTVFLINVDDYTIPNTYVISEIGRTINSNIIVYTKKTNALFHFVKSSIFFMDYYDYSNILLGYENYKEIIVGGEAPFFGFLALPNPYDGIVFRSKENVDCWIFPPGKNLNYIKKESGDAILRREGVIQEYVPDYLVDLIQRYSVLRILENRTPTKEEIYDTYIRLILDLLNDKEKVYGTNRDTDDDPE